MHNGSQSVRVPSMQCRGRGVCANDTVCVSACVSAGVFRPQGRALGDELVTNLCPRASLSDAVLIACTRTRQHRMERTHRGHRPHRCPGSSRSSPARAPGLAQSALAQQAQVPRRTPERRAYSFPARRISEAPSVIALPQSVDVEAAAAISTQFWSLQSSTWRDNIFRCNAFCTAFNFSSQRLRCSEEMADDQTSGDRPGLLQPQGAEGRSDEDAEAQPHSRLLPPPPANSEVAPRHDSNTPESALAPSQAFVSAHSQPHSGTALHPASRSRYTRTWHINRGPMHPHPSLRSSLTGLFSDAAGTAMAVGLTDTPTQRQLARSRKRFFV